MSLRLRDLPDKGREMTIGQGPGSWTGHKHDRIPTAIGKYNHFLLGTRMEVFSKCRWIGTPRQSRTSQQNKFKGAIHRAGCDGWRFPAKSGK